MNKCLLFAVLLLAPAVAPATTLVTQFGGPYDVTSDRLFTGVVTSAADGAGTYTVDFFSPSQVTKAVADVAVTSAAVTVVFKDLSMSWLDGESLNTLVQVPGIDTLSTVFHGAFMAQRLQFEWSDSTAGAGFGFDVTTTPIPLPASVFLLAAALGGLGVVRSRRVAA